MTHYKSLAGVALALLLLAACGSTGGDVFGGNNGSSYDLRGTVDSVDLNSRSVYLTNVSGNGGMLSGSGGSSVRVFFNDSTPVDYQGRTYRPADLERGDQVSVRVDQSGSRLNAESMSVLYNANASNSYPGSSNPNYPNGTYGSTIHGTVTYVDTSRRTIQVDRGYGSTVTLNYNSNTPVYFNGRSYYASDLERGDEIDINAQDLGGGRLVAQDITVTRSVNGGMGSSSSTSNLSTLRGTVRSVDTSRNLIQLDSASWIAGFNRGNTTGSSYWIQYDANTRVDFQGQLYPVANLERGDVIDVQASGTSSSTLFAQRILLVRDINGR